MKRKEKQARKNNALDHYDREDHVGEYRITLVIREELIRVYKGKTLIKAVDARLRDANARYDRMHANLKRMNDKHMRG